MTSRGGVIGLVPARNAEHLVAGCLDSLEVICDAIVALDDGSTDGTHATLTGSDIVEVLLTNPARESFMGWDDGENRRRLLAAAAELEPRWIVSLDADERIAADDGAELRRFLQTDAIAGCAYGLKCYRLLDETRYDPAFTWVYRVFAHRPGQRFPAERLDFNPVPTDVPRRAWLKTSLRVQHVVDGAGGLASRLAKYREADPPGRYRSYYERQRPPAPESAPEWEPRAAGLPVLLAPSPLSASRTPTVRPPTVVCLLQARNCADQIPEYVHSASRFADGIVALYDDDDPETGAALAASPLIRVVLTNPRPEGSRWDDAGNRNRLLEAAASLDPDWVMVLDADERIPEDDARALRTFLDEDARPGFVYGFAVHRMIDDLEHFDKSALWVYRLFAFAPGQTFPDQFHGVCVPTDITPRRWLKTSVPIQHLSSLTDAHRRRRFEKYQRADPDRIYQRDYDHLLDPPRDVKCWEHRPPDLPVLTPEADRRMAAELEWAAGDIDGPVLSAVVISRDDEDCIERSVRSVVEQDCPEPFEVIVVTSGRDRTAEIVRTTFPNVRVIELAGPALPGRARNAGLAAATGDYISFPGSHIQLAPGSLAARLRAHELGYDMVTGTMLNGTDTPAGWASYFLDNSHCMPGRPSGLLEIAPARCSYRRDALLCVGGFPELMRTGEDTVVNRALHRRGFTTYRSNEITLTHNSPCRGVRTLVRHHFERGQGMGRILRQEAAAARRPLFTRKFARTWLVDYLPQRLERTRRNVARWGGGLTPRFKQVYPLVVLGSAAAWAGMWCELLRPSGTKASTPAPVIQQHSAEPDSPDARTKTLVSAGR